MKALHCVRETEVLDALRSGRWSSAWGEEIRRHVADCAVCAEVVFVAELLRSDEERAQECVRRSGKDLPSAGLVWWRAQLAARRAAEHQAAKPIALAERAAYSLGGLTVFGLEVWQWPRIESWLRARRLPVLSRYTLPLADWIRELAKAIVRSWPSHAPVLLMAMSGAAALAVLALAAYVLCREE